MALLARNGLAGFPRNGTEEIILTGMTGVGTNNPFSSRFEIPDWLSSRPTPYNLVMYLKQAHEEHNLPFGDWRFHLRSAKNLLEDYDVDVIARSIRYCSTIAKHSFTFKMVREKIEKETIK